ncbi:MAG TPA: virulence protein [Clostridiales bacterium]|nr:virulence protein [Clostridiales bacterium]
MQVKYNATGAKRKELVKAIADATEAKAKYMGMPTAAYEIDYFSVTKDGTLLFDDRADSDEVEKVLEAIAAAGFECEVQEGFKEESEELTQTATQTAAEGLTVEMPRSFFNDGALDNLKRIVESKSALIKKAVGADALPIEVTDEKVSFPWFTEVDADTVHAYTTFISKLSEMAKNATRVTATEKAVDNEKYAFRCFLLRLGFIGADYKTDRKILLKNLTGSSAFRNGGADHEISE